MVVGAVVVGPLAVVEVVVGAAVGDESSFVTNAMVAANEGEDADHGRDHDAGAAIAAIAARGPVGHRRGAGGRTVRDDPGHATFG